ncbi:hypothetical protein BDZ89DRAFT_1064890 [Hymenopellis radicata]|nr:hypothetical protein BDZ89DRAFT_1064890 [Hymenopellis radicata]
MPVLLVVGRGFVSCRTAHLRKGWMRIAKAVVMFMLKVLAVPTLMLGVFAKHQARQIQALGDLVLDVLVMAVPIIDAPLKERN